MTNNKLTMLLTRGVSGSGKSYWTKQFLQDNPNFREVNRDEIRISLFGQENMWKGDEKKVTLVQEALIKSLLHVGTSLVISDTNLNNKTVNRLMQLAGNYGAEVEWKDFTDVPLHTCLDRDSKREFPVGADVIKRQYYKYVMKNEHYRDLHTYCEQNAELPHVILVDVDGTSTSGPNFRSPYEWLKVGQDLPNTPVVNLVNELSLNPNRHAIIFLSGRDSICRKETEEWIRKTFAENMYFLLYMREQNDNRSDAIIKKELYEKHIKGTFYVEFILDDRKRVVDFWRSEGLACFQVHDGDF